MAEVTNWTNQVVDGEPAASVTDLVSEPCVTRRFADGHATNWCRHLVPGYIGAVRVTNLGATTLYVSTGPALTGAASATQHVDEIPAGQGRLYSFVGQAPRQPPRTLFSTWGLDGAAHPIGIVFEAVP